VLEFTKESSSSEEGALLRIAPEQWASNTGDKDFILNINDYLGNVVVYRASELGLDNERGY